MIISFKHKFVFVKTRKVAGTAVEAALRPFLGEDDIVPCVTPRDEVFSLKNGFKSRNWAVNPNDEVKYNELVLKGDFDSAIDFLSSIEKKFISHMTALNIRRKILAMGMKPRDFYWFTIERNPYSYMTSSIRYNNKNYNSSGSDGFEFDDEEISERASKILTREWFLKRLNHKMYLDNNEDLLVDKILSFENISSELKSFCSSIGIDAKEVDLPFMKVQKKRSMPVFNESALELINDKFSWVFNNLGYSEINH